MQQHMPTLQNTVCRRCGRCCRQGGPALHRIDLPLFRRGVLAPGHLLTLRRGEYVTDNVAGGIGPSPEELVKLQPGPDGRTCLFFREPAACAIHQDRPAECRVLYCDAPEALTAMYRNDRLSRSDILAAASPLAALCAHHETETSLPRLDALCRRAAGGDAAARDEVRRIVRFDAAFRDLLPERAGVSPETLLFYLGRPPTLALPACRAALAPDGLYKPSRCA
jgi:Fe-S-cluster containining protein